MSRSPSPTIAVITGSTGDPLLAEAARSVVRQTWAAHIEHWIVVDGPQFEHATCRIIGKLPESDVVHRILVLPTNTGGSGYVCHRINGAVPWLVDTDYVCFLDQDNMFDETHVQKLVEALPAGGRWAHSLRKIVNKEGVVVCLDACESLGGLCHTVLNPRDRLVDTNTYLLDRTLAVQISSLWNVRARQQGVMEADRQVCRTLLQHEPVHGVSRSHSVQYRVDGRADSVSAIFFKRGNAVLGAGVGGYDFVHKKDIYLFHFTKEQTAEYVANSPVSPLAEWCPGMWHGLCGEYNLLDGYAALEFMPIGAVCLAAMCHPSSLPLSFFASRPDLTRIVYTAEGPNIRHASEQWSRDFLSKHFDVALTYWEPLLQTPGPRLKTVFCPHNSRFLEFPMHLPLLRTNRGEGRSVGVVLEKRALDGTYEIDGISLKCLDQLRETYVTGLRNCTVYGIGWRDYCATHPAVKLGHGLPRSQDPNTSVDHLQNHVFALVVENTDADGYVSEKFADCFIAGCIPLYYGSPSPRVPLPHGTYVNLRPFRGGAGVQAYIDALSDAEIEEMQRAISACRVEFLECRGRRAVADAVRLGIAARSE
jgi:hypothetical protein